MHRYVWLLALVLTGCHGVEWRCGTVTPEAAALAGRRAAPALIERCGGLERDPVALARMERIGARLDRSGEQAWTYHLLASDQINAFSLPGGLIYITRGLYERIGTSDQVLAAVLAHEMAHVHHGDSLKPRCGSRHSALNREREADRVGMHILAESGYPAESMVHLLRLIADQQSEHFAKARLDAARNLSSSSVEAIPLQTSPLASR